jgi:hypothetical protein
MVFAIVLHEAFVIDGRKRPLSAEHREKISLAQKGKKRGPMKISPETELERRRKIAAALLGRPLSDAHRAKLSSWHSQKKLSEPHKANIGAGHRGKKRSDETRAKISAANKGQKPTASCINASRAARRNGLNLSDEARRRKSERFSGANSPSWKGGITPENARVRTSREMKAWRKAVFQRDDFTCRECSTRGGDMNAHHVKPFCTHPELRFEIDNGLTVCEPCHRDIHRGWRADKRIT